MAKAGLSSYHIQIPAPCEHGPPALIFIRGEARLRATLATWLTALKISAGR